MYILNILYKDKAVINKMIYTYFTALYYTLLFIIMTIIVQCNLLPKQFNPGMITLHGYAELVRQLLF